MNEVWSKSFMWIGIAAVSLGLAITPAYGQQEAEGARIEFMDLTNMDINEILKVLSDTSEWNIIPSKEVTGRVFVFLKDIDVEAALKAVIEVNNYRYIREGNTITVMTREQYELRVGPETEMRVFKLDYARVAQVAPLLRGALSSEGMVTPDVANNQLIVWDLPNRFQRLQELIDSIDQETETRVIALSHARAADLRVSLRQLVGDPARFEIDERTNRLIVTDTPYYLDQLEEVARQLDLEDLTETRTYVLQYADAEDVADLLIEMITGQRSGGQRGLPLSGRRPGAEAASPIAALAGGVSPRTRRDETRSTLVSSVTRTEESLLRPFRPLEAPPRAAAEVVIAEVAEALSGEARALGVQGTIAADSRTNTLIVTHTPATLIRIEQVIEALDVENPLYTYQFEHANLESLALEEKLGELLSGRGQDFQIDYNTRKVTFRSATSRADHILSLFGEWDEPVPQVYIEARILRVAVDTMRNLGATIRINNQRGDDDIGQILDIRFPPAISEVPQGLLQFGDLTADEYTVILQALESDSRSKLLGKPNVNVLDHREAIFQVVVDQPFVEIVTDANSDITRESTRFIPVGITLSVSPQIRSNGIVEMDVRVEVSSLLSLSPEGIPVIDRSEASTSVHARDGHTVVLGGLILEERIETINRVPWLGEIPIIKYLFRNKSNDYGQSEIVLFITPHLSDTGSPESPPDQLELGPGKIDP